MIIERNFFAEAESPAQGKTGEQPMRNVPTDGKPDIKKKKSFERLEKSVLEFAEVCCLNVRMTVTEDLYGVIRFETKYFEVTWREPQEVNAFWIYLISAADRFSISQCSDFFRIEFIFDLFVA